mmetsp:Transcript_30436/g.64435  ORF Transcript_30436/g.64435 Transcript_30436/m.64435 type:complete len:537 (+) Transcript_30436:251-1861(+)|eukprot:CAMPEP_0172301030 /NCGR_PEP_ID=MMETSP1058-20130122/3008_1 /TAXON_ID=83371 /ORGANISM="Detonula confervacea, Strain CCMP 353" /LENGTH=536 /DNA_ID=CAMNT_0013011019 /DNA_START=176 /DNA_END=1786 /DNA_ORIENTATION=+
MGIATPAFAGANFDSCGSCLHHPEIKLTQKTTVDGGKVVYKELRRRCPKCTSSRTSPDIKRHESTQSSNSHGNNAYRRERRPPSNNNSNAGAKSPSSPNPSLARSSSRSRARSKSPSRDRAPARSKSPSRDRARSRSRVVSRVPARKAKKEFSTPFDAKGLCHYHPNVQLAKKKLTGGWKLLHGNCPKCAEDKYNDDNRSVASRRSNKSSRSVKSSGGRKKNRSPKFECPFNNKGYCHRHSHVRLAKKKLTGGWKILLQFCAECVEEDNKYDDNRSVCSRSSRMSRKSACSRSSRRSLSSRRSGRHQEAESDSELSTSQSEQNQKKVVKRMDYTDDNGEEGQYTGYVNSQYKPHGSGKLVYGNGKRFSGEWCEGTKVHGKTSNEKSKKKDRKERRDKNTEPSKGSSKNGTTTTTSSSVKATPPVKENEAAEKRKLEQKRNALKEYKELYNNAAQVVKNMVFVDFYGDRGRYTGEVNGQKMPHGNGEITYDHGLVQGGTWSRGVLDDEGSIISGNEKRQGERNPSSTSRRRGRSKDP